jgi:hypothetical protein
MRSIFVWAAAAVALALVGSHLPAQELIATPDPVGGAKTDAGANINVGDQPHPAPAANAAGNNWRYRWYNGHWWYWTTQNRWMWYGDDHHWVAYDANHSPPTVENHDNNGMAYEDSYPGPGRWAGYYPGVAVGVRPYGDVSVGVGRRVGVDVCGPHGAVRVGRLYIGW